MLSLYRFVWQRNRTFQIGLALLSLVVAGLTMVPLELQRRIINEAIGERDIRLLAILCGIYAGVVALQGALKFAMRMGRGRIAAGTVRDLRMRTFCHADAADDPRVAVSTDSGQGTAISIISSEVRQIGGFVGSAISEPVAQGGMLIAVFGYMLYVQPSVALAAMAVFAPQVIVVPKVQAMINERTRKRTEEIRSIGDSLTGPDGGEDDESRMEDNRSRIDRIYRLQMRSYLLKHGLKLFINVLKHAATLTVLGFGGWLVIQGRSEVGTVVAFLSGVERIYDPWRDLVRYYRSAADAAVKWSLVDRALSPR